MSLEPTRLDRVRRFFAKFTSPIYVLRAPLLVTILASLLLVLPDQVLELYRSMALSIGENTLAPTAAYLTLIVMCTAIWHVARTLTLQWQHGAILNADLHARVLRWLPRLLGAAPFVAAATGVYAARGGIARLSGLTNDEAEQMPGTVPGLLSDLLSAKADIDGARQLLAITAIVLALSAVAFILITSWRSRSYRAAYENPNRALFSRPAWRTAGAIAVLLVGSTVAFFFTSPAALVATAQTFGALAVFHLFIICLAYILALLTNVYDATNVPVASSLVALALISTAFDLNDNHTLQAYTPPASQSGQAVQSSSVDAAGSDQAQRIAPTRDRGTAGARNLPAATPEQATSTARQRRERRRSAQLEALGTGLSARRRRRLSRAERAFERWVARRPNLSYYTSQGRKLPVYIVAAQGGGIYAAHHAATTLAGLQERCPGFPAHVFAISGVSGGSLGAALFAGLAEKNARPTPGDPCVGGDVVGRQATTYQTRGIGGRGRVGGALAPGVPAPAPNAPVAAGRLIRQVDDFLAKDFLAPITAAGFFPDFVQRFLPVPIGKFDRARALEASFKSAWRDAVANGDGENFFAKKFRSTWTPSALHPALVLNTTLVQTGDRVVIAPFHFRRQTPSTLPNLLRLTQTPLSVATAVSVSARFPWVLPAASFRIDAAEVERRQQVLESTRSADNPRVQRRIKRMSKQIEDGTLQFRFVDGGYFEYSGVDTAMDIKAMIDRLQRKRIDAQQEPLPIEVSLIVIGDDEMVEQAGQKELRERLQRAGFGEVGSPVLALLNSSIARGTLSVTRAVEKLCPGCFVSRRDRRKTPGFDGEVRMFRLNSTDFPLTLGWQLSTVSRKIVSSHIGIANRCFVGPTEMVAKMSWQERVINENNCAACRILHDLRSEPRRASPDSLLVAARSPGRRRRQTRVSYNPYFLDVPEGGGLVCQ